MCLLIFSLAFLVRKRKKDSERDFEKVCLRVERIRKKERKLVQAKQLLSNYGRLRFTRHVSISSMPYFLVSLPCNFFIA